MPAVVTEEAAVARAAGIGIEIEMAGARVRVSPGVDPALLAVSYKHRKAVAAALKQEHGRRPGDLLRRRPPQCGGLPRVRRGQRLLWP